MPDETMKAYMKAYAAALPECRREFADDREAKDHASAIATAVAFGHTDTLRDSAAARAALAVVA